MAWNNRYSGVLLLDKPRKLTSHDVVHQVRRILEQQEVGHTGTLDPLATGLLVICLGRATKCAQFISSWEKNYLGEVCLGLTSPTYDAEGLDPLAHPIDVRHISADAIVSVLGGFVGTQLQAVPAHSAVRLNGRHLYDLTRQGIDPVIPERQVTISSIRLVEYSCPVARIEVNCSKGTYIRTLAHQIGERLRCGAYLSDLRRTAVGQLTVEQAVSLEQLARLADEGTVNDVIQPIGSVLRFGSVCIDDQFRKLLGYGRIPAWQNVCRIEGQFEPGDRVIVKSADGEVLAVAIAAASSEAFSDHSGQPVASYVRVLA